MKEIWCLFSIECKYDQPPNNLIAWWENVPTASQIAAASDLIEDQAETLLKNYWLTYDIPCVVEYRLEKCAEGKHL